MAFFFTRPIQSQVCGSQSWHHGWLEKYGITYQEMDFSSQTSYLAVGGYTTSLAEFEIDPTAQELINFNDAQGAILLVFDAASPSTQSFEPLRHAIMSEYHLFTTKLVGVRSIAI